jgi:hypothetical protein
VLDKVREMQVVLDRESSQKLRYHYMMQNSGKARREYTKTLSLSGTYFLGTNVGLEGNTDIRFNDQMRNGKP